MNTKTRRSSLLARRRADSGGPLGAPSLLRDQVRERVKQSILTGEFSPGQFLGELWLAERLAVSRTPVREALAALQRDGLVDMAPRRGAFVRWPSPKDVEDLFDVRIGIELQALKRAFPKLSRDTLRSLLERVERQEADLERAGYKNIEQLGVEVHLTVLRAAGNRPLTALSHQLREQVYIATTLYRNLDGSVNLPRVQQVAKDHRALLSALIAGDLQGALGELEAHLVRTREMVIAALREGTSAVAAAPGVPLAR
jgi:DNA-binding GntR family transcriptional regulator